jgi:hypothetical protein
MKKIELYRIRGLLLFCGLFLMFSSCSKKDHFSNEDSILSFSITVNGEQKTGVQTDVGDTIKFKMAPGFDTTLLKDLTPSIYISGYSTISPLPSISQDFNNPVTYTVTAQDGTIKEWIIKWTYGDRIKDGAGGGATIPLWYKTPEELGINSTGLESSIGICGDYLVFSRSKKTVNKYTGEPTSQLLNTTGVPGQIYFLTNDDKGNLVGSTLPAISSGKFNVYRWTSIDADPELVYSENYTSGAMPGRKFDIAGDINGTAIFSTNMYENGKSTGTIRRWKVLGGSSVSEISSVVVPIGEEYPATATSIQWQSFAMSAPEENARFYATVPALLWGSLYSGIVVKYGNPGDATLSKFKGSFVQDDGSAGGGYWGNIIHGHVSAFDFNGKTYVAACGFAWSRYTYCLVADEDLFPDCVGKNIGYWYGTIPYTDGVGNGTSAITVSNENDNSMLIYVYVEGGGVACGEMTRYER